MRPGPVAGGWALWKSLMTLVEDPRPHTARCTDSVWRRGAGDIVAQLAEHRRST